MGRTKVKEVDEESSEKKEEITAKGITALEAFVYEILHPSNYITSEPLELHYWNETYYLHDYYPHRKWKSIKEEYASLSEWIYNCKKRYDEQYYFELIWAIMHVCENIPEKTIYLFNVPSSEKPFMKPNETPITEIIGMLDETRFGRSLGDLMYRRYLHYKMCCFLKRTFCLDKKFIACPHYIERTESLVPNHERPKRRMKKATFEEQLNSMAFNKENEPFEQLDAANSKKCFSKDMEDSAALIIDDIMTSGASINAAYTIVEQAKYERNLNFTSILKLTVARTV